MAPIAGIWLNRHNHTWMVNLHPSFLVGYTR